MPVSEFRTERVLFHIVAQGSIEIEYEVGVETAEQAFRHWFTPDKYAREALSLLVSDSDLNWTITCTTEPAGKQGMSDLGETGDACNQCGTTKNTECIGGGWFCAECMAFNRNDIPLHPGPGDTPDSHADEDMARRDQFQAEQEELSRSIDQMLRGGRD